MAFRSIDLATWPRREYYLHYTDQVPCSYSLTVEVDITPLEGQRLYPAMLWLLTDTVNRFESFRTDLTRAGLGIHEDMTPSYTVLNREQGNFCVLWTAFTPDYAAFLRRYEEDVQRYGASQEMFPKPDRPANCFDVSMLPWLHFTSFELALHDAPRYLLPIFTLGKAVWRDGKRWLPLSIRVHHAVCDGYHVACFVDALQTAINTFGT